MFVTRESGDHFVFFSLQILGALGVVECALLWLGLTVEEEERGTYSGDRYENDSKFPCSSAVPRKSLHFNQIIF